jgi:anti-sigma factor RsiW
MTEHSHCQDLLGSLSEYVDGTLRAELCSMLESHLEGCERCQVVVNTLRKTIEIYHANGEMAVELPTDIRARLFACLDLSEFLPGVHKNTA